MAVIVKGITSSGGGAKIATVLNDDGTQNLIIVDKDTVLDLAYLTADADAVEEDVAEGKVFYAQGMRKVGTNAAASVPEIFGDGSDGVGLFTANTTWNADTEDTGMIVKNFESLTISEGVTVSAGNRNCGMIVRVKGDCTIAGSLVNKLSSKIILDSDGVDFTAVYPASMLSSKAGDGGSGGSAVNSGLAGGAGMTGRIYGGGWSGGGGGGTINSYRGGAGGAVSNVTTAVTSIFVGAQRVQNSAGNAGTNGGGGAGGSWGTASTYYGGNGGSGYGGAGGDSGTYGGGGGGAGNIGGGVIILLVGGNLTITGTIDCSGGNGGAGGSGRGGNGVTAYGGSGGGGAGGGRIFICHKGSVSNTGTLNVNGGGGGSAGTGANGSGNAGTAGSIGTTAVKTYEQYMEEDVA